MTDKKLKKMMMEAFKESKAHMIQSGTKIIGKICGEVMEMESFGDNPETIHTLQEESIVKGLFFAHAAAVEKYCDMIVRMLDEGVLKVDKDSLSKAADSIRKSLEKLDEEGDDEDEDEGDDE